MITWDYFRRVRKLNVLKWCENLNIKSYEDFVSRVESLGVIPSTKEEFEKMIPPKTEELQKVPEVTPTVTEEFIEFAPEIAPIIEIVAEEIQQEKKKSKKKLKYLKAKTMNNYLFIPGELVCRTNESRSSAFPDGACGLLVSPIKSFAPLWKVLVGQTIEDWSAYNFQRIDTNGKITKSEREGSSRSRNNSRHHRTST